MEHISEDLHKQETESYYTKKKKNKKYNNNIKYMKNIINVKSTRNLSLESNFQLTKLENIIYMTTMNLTQQVFKYKTQTK